MFFGIFILLKAGLTWESFLAIAVFGVLAFLFIRFAIKGKTDFRNRDGTTNLDQKLTPKDIWMRLLSAISVIVFIGCWLIYKSTH
jgi:cytochrome bd-type quinol oxidase subunit 2